jgi:membrane protease YdiL (CAAX protease family)
MSFLKSLALRFPILAFLALTFSLTWVCVAYLAAGQSGRLGHEPSLLWLALVGQFAPLWAAIALVGLQAGGSGIKALLRGLLAFRLGAGPWLLALLAAPAQAFLACSAFLLAGGDLDFTKVHWGQAVAGLVVGTLIGLVFGGLSEEIGWRGYLQPRLQRRLHPAVAGALVGVVWALWHLDPEILALLFSKGRQAFLDAWLPYQARYLSETIPFALLMTALYNRTRGSLLAMCVIHASSNALVVALWSTWKPIPPALRAWDLAVAWLLAVALLVLWRKAPVHQDTPGMAPDLEAVQDSRA